MPWFAFLTHYSPKIRIARLASILLDVGTGFCYNGIVFAHADSSLSHKRTVTRCASQGDRPISLRCHLPKPAYRSRVAPFSVENSLLVCIRCHICFMSQKLKI
jgi:hypothetical protein